MSSSYMKSMTLSLFYSTPTLFKGSFVSHILKFYKILLPYKPKSLTVFMKSQYECQVFFSIFFLIVYAD